MRMDKAIRDFLIEIEVRKLPLRQLGVTRITSVSFCVFARKRRMLRTQRTWVCLSLSNLHSLWAMLGEVEHIVKRHGAGIDGIRVSPHTCRHFYAQQHIKMGTDLYTISRLLGHENIQITQTYLNSLRDKEVISISKQKSVLLSLWMGEAAANSIQKEREIMRLPLCFYDNAFMISCSFILRTSNLRQSSSFGIYVLRGGRYFLIYSPSFCPISSVIASYCCSLASYRTSNYMARWGIGTLFKMRYLASVPSWMPT